MQQPQAFGHEQVVMELIRGVLDVVADKPNLSPDRRFAAQQTVVCSVMAYNPRDPIETMLAGQCIVYDAVMRDGARDMLRGQAELIKLRARASVLSAGKMFLATTDMAIRMQGRAADQLAFARPLHAPAEPAETQARAPAPATSETPATPPPDALPPAASPAPLVPHPAASAVHPVPPDVQRAPLAAHPVPAAVHAPPSTAQRAPLAPHPAPADPTPAGPAPSGPASADPTPADPAPADPAPADPAPADPAPADPTPAGPAPSGPAPSGPAPSGIVKFATALAAMTSAAANPAEPAHGGAHVPGQAAPERAPTATVAPRPKLREDIDERLLEGLTELEKHDVRKAIFQAARLANQSPPLATANTGERRRADSG